jgi:hypothetical protein
MRLLYFLNIALWDSLLYNCILSQTYVEIKISSLTINIFKPFLFYGFFLFLFIVQKLVLMYTSKRKDRCVSLSTSSSQNI